MKKLYSISEIISSLINIVMSALTLYFTFFYRDIFDNYIWTMIFGMWAGWSETRHYYKNRMQSNRQKESGQFGLRKNK